ncbi:MAG: DUF2892 domain-containing protein [Halodesulfurarchaeum sp.]
MERNVGVTDRNVRLAVGIVLGLLGIVSLSGVLDLGSWLVGAVLLVIGVVLVGTGVTRTCLLYRPLGIDTGR